MSNLVAGVGVEPTYEAYETSDWAASLTRNKLVQEAGVEPAAARLSVECSAI